jgi:hypothetical protein
VIADLDPSGWRVQPQRPRADRRGALDQPHGIGAVARQGRDVREHVERRARGERVGAERDATAGLARGAPAGELAADLHVGSRTQHHHGPAAGGEAERLVACAGHVDEQRAGAQQAQAVQVLDGAHPGRVAPRQQRPHRAVAADEPGRLGRILLHVNRRSSHGAQDVFARGVRGVRGHPHPRVRVGSRKLDVRVRKRRHHLAERAEGERRRGERLDRHPGVGHVADADGAAGLERRDRGADRLELRRRAHLQEPRDPRHQPAASRHAPGHVRQLEVRVTVGEPGHDHAAARARVHAGEVVDPPDRDELAFVVDRDRAVPDRLRSGDDHPRRGPGGDVAAAGELHGDDPGHVESRS